VSLESPWNYIVIAGVGLVVLSLAIPVSKILFQWLADRGVTEEDRWASELQKINLIRGEVAAGKLVVERAIGQNQVYELVNNDNWFAHRNSLAANRDAIAAYRLAAIAWDGFWRYNAAVDGRTSISNETLDSIAKDAQRADDALGVAAQKSAVR
jgi:hypothetical protein